MVGTLPVAAVVLNYNSSADCRKCVAYLKKQNYPDLSIFIVDNASPDPEEAEALTVLQQENHLHLIRSPKNRGFSAGNNLGLRAAAENGAAWMLVMNPDVELRDPYYISKVMGQLENWPKAAVIGTDILLPNGQKQNPSRELRYGEELFWPIEWIKQKLKITDGYRTEDRTGYCEKVSGCCFFISKKFLEQIHYLDENVFMYCEEPILAKQVVLNGYREVYISSVTAYHQHFASKKGNAKKRMQMLFESRQYYLKHYSGYSGLALQLLLLSKKIQRQFWK